MHNKHLWLLFAKAYHVEHMSSFQRPLQMEGQRKRAMKM